MTTTTYPVTVLNILDDLNNLAEGEDWGDIWNAVTDDRDKELTETLINSDACDFIVLDGDDAFVFISNDQTGVWTVKHVGKPVYYVEPEMIGSEDFDGFDTFLIELKYLLAGVEVKYGSALQNQRSEFVEWFCDELSEAFQKALSSL